MPNTRYSYNVDLDNLTTSHSLAVHLVPPGSTVLDIGAADGSVARALAARGCRVWAIESVAAAAEKARSACERVIVGDVEQLDLEQAIEGRRFDAVLLLDVLEHLREPLIIIERARDVLAPGGRIIASIPNVAHGAVRVSLMSGAFTYTEVGLLDRTHLRFFDRRSAEALFDDARLQIVERLRVTRALTETEIPIDPSAVSSEILEMLAKDPEANTYQFVLAGVPSKGNQVPDGVSLSERLQRRTEALEAQYRKLEGYVESIEKGRLEQIEMVNHLTTHTTALEEELQRVRTELQSELKARMEELAQGDLGRRHLQADLAVKEAYIVDLRQAAARAQDERARLQSEREARTRELAQGDLERRHLREDIGEKDALIAHLRQAASGMHDELAALRGLANSATVRIVTKMIGRLSNYPKLYQPLRRVVRRVAARRA